MMDWTAGLKPLPSSSTAQYHCPLAASCIYYYYHCLSSLSPWTHLIFNSFRACYGGRTYVYSWWARTDRKEWCLVAAGVGGSSSSTFIGRVAVTVQRGREKEQRNDRSLDVVLGLRHYWPPRDRRRQIHGKLYPPSHVASFDYLFDHFSLTFPYIIGEILFSTYNNHLFLFKNLTRDF